MTDQLYDEREDEREAQEAARGPTERDEEGKAYTPDATEADEGERELPPDA
jgi:hypothetical protein